MKTNLYGCNCDYPKDYTKYGLTIDNVRVTVMSKDGQLFQKVENPVANLNGVMHVAVPTCTEYVVNVDNLREGDEDDYLTLESAKIGERDVSISSRKLYHPSSIEIKGFKEGSNESFMFISQSQREKNEGRELEGENETNVIELKVQRWKRVRRPEIRAYGYDYFGLECHNGRGPIPKGGYRSRGGPESMQLQSKGLSKGGGCEEGSIFDAEPTMACGAAESFSGGATVSGGSYVDRIRSTTTSDRFDRVGEPIELLVQLVCTQTEEEKYAANEQYYLKKAMEERKEIQKKIEQYQRNVDYLQDEISRYQKRLEKETETLCEMRQQLKKYDYLGSTNKRDHLMDFASGDSKVINVTESTTDASE